MPRGATPRISDELTPSMAPGVGHSRWRRIIRTTKDLSKHRCSFVLRVCPKVRCLSAVSVSIPSAQTRHLHMLFRSDTRDVAVIVGTDDDRRASCTLYVEEGVELPAIVGVDVRERFIED